MFTYFGNGAALLAPWAQKFIDLNREIGYPTSLCKIMNAYGSDKGLGWHNYTMLYSDLFGNRRSEITSVLEIGLGTNNPELASSMGIDGRPGASVRGWRDFFSNAQIYGADIDDKILFEDERIKTFYVDQTSTSSVNELFEKIGAESFDIIIDDGLHEYKAAQPLLMTAYQFLKKGGMYVIEDILIRGGEIEKYLNLFETMALSGVVLELNNDLNNTDNCLVIIVKPNTN